MARCPTSTGAISAILGEMENVGIRPGIWREMNILWGFGSRCFKVLWMRFWALFMWGSQDEGDIADNTGEVTCSKPPSCSLKLVTLTRIKSINNSCQTKVILQSHSRCLRLSIGSFGIWVPISLPTQLLLSWFSFYHRLGVKDLWK